MDLLNDLVARERAERLADKVIRECGYDDDSYIPAIEVRKMLGGMMLAMVEEAMNQRARPEGA